MGWARTLFLGDIGNRLDIADAEHEIETLRQQLLASHAGRATLQQRVNRLERENQEVELFAGLLVKQLVAKNVLTPEDARRLADAIDPEP